MPMVTKLVKVVIYHEELPPTNLHDPPIAGLVRLRDKLNTLYLHLQKTQCSKLGRVLTHHDRLPPLKPNDFLIT